jgi:hypothetical protein
LEILTVPNSSISMLPAAFLALSAVVVATISEADRDTIIVSAPGGLVDVAQPTAVCTWTRHAATGGG